MGLAESTPLWSEHRNLRYKTYHGMRVEQHQLIRTFMEAQVSKEEVVNVDAVVKEILAHPHRKHFGTLAVPSAEDIAQFEGIFNMGVPASVVYSFAHWFRMSQPLESAREKYLTCKLVHASDDACVGEAMAMVKLYQTLAELPFRKCPKESAEMVHCVEHLGRYKAGLYPGRRDFHSFNRWCDPEMGSWEQCMTKEYGVGFPPRPEFRKFFHRSARYTNLSLDKVYS